MANLIIKNLKTVTDKGKAIPELEHDFCPTPETAPEIMITCSYLQAGELNKYLSVSRSGNIMIPDLRGIFRDKVRLITGLTINGQKVTEPKELLAYPSIDMLDEIIRETATHLSTSYDIEEAEVKN